MLSWAKINKLIFILFKYATIVHIFFLLLTIAIKHMFTESDTIYLTIDYIIMLTALFMSMCVTTKGIHYFTAHHKKLIAQHKFIALITEYVVASCMIFAFFINEEISGQFILFINDISLKVHSNKMIAALIFICVYLGTKLYHSFKLQKIYMDNKSLLHLISAYTLDVIIKLILLAGLVFGLYHPTIKALQTFRLAEFAQLILKILTISWVTYLQIIAPLGIVFLLAVSLHYTLLRIKKK